MTKVTTEAEINRRKQWVAFYTVIALLSVLTIAVTIALMIVDRQIEPHFTTALLFAMLAVYSAFNAWKIKKISIPKPVIVEIVRCIKCGYNEQKEPQKGDYVNKVVGQCPKCGGDMKVYAIYQHMPRPQTAKNITLHANLKQG